jgi:hypothetical protein
MVKFYNMKTLQKNSTLEVRTSQEGYARILELVNYHHAMSFVGWGFQLNCYQIKLASCSVNVAFSV